MRKPYGFLVPVLGLTLDKGRRRSRRLRRRPSRKQVLPSAPGFAGWSGSTLALAVALRAHRLRLGESTANNWTSANSNQAQALTPSSCP